MERYINADKMIADTKAMKNVAGSIEIDGIVKYIEEHIAADVQEVKHGEWLDNGANYKCSICGNTESYYSDSYCRVCGARMDGDKNV